jgi:O-antigen ligase
LLGTATLSLFLSATGIIELVTGIDLFQYKGSELVREGERRVNGPFASDSSYAIICLLLFLFLVTAPRLIRAKFDRTARLVYVCATAAAAVGAALSLFRVVAFALIFCWGAQRWLASGAHTFSPNRADLRRVLPAALLAGVILTVVVGWLVFTVPERSGLRLINPRSVFGRLATWQGAAEIAFENPFFGVGLADYATHYDLSHYYSGEAREEVLDTKAAANPHSNLLWIASELGLPAASLYAFTNICLFLMGWRALKKATGQRQRLAASCFLAIVIAYWIPGVTLASGYYSDLNLYFLFLLGTLSTEFGDRKLTEQA